MTYDDVKKAYEQIPVIKEYVDQYRKKHRCNLDSALNSQDVRKRYQHFLEVRAMLCYTYMDDDQEGWEEFP